MADRKGDDFWKFSLAFYDDPEVQAALIALQDRAGVDVNVLLYLLYHAALGAAFTQGAIAELDGTIRLWRDEIVRPLRKLRRRLKDTTLPVDDDAREALRNDIKRSELRSEKLQQYVMASLDPKTHDAALHVAARENLRFYAEYLEIAAPVPEFDPLLRRFGHILPRVQGSDHSA